MGHSSGALTYVSPLRNRSPFSLMSMPVISRSIMICRIMWISSLDLVISSLWLFTRCVLSDPGVGNVAAQSAW